MDPWMLFPVSLDGPQRRKSLVRSPSAVVYIADAINSGSRPTASAAAKLSSIFTPLGSIRNS